MRVPENDGAEVLSLPYNTKGNIHAFTKKNYTSKKFKGLEQLLSLQKGEKEVIHNLCFIVAAKS